MNLYHNALMGVKYYLIVSWICISIMASYLNISHTTCWPFEWRNVCLSPLPIYRAQRETTYEACALLLIYLPGP